jgi:hypothetical protein
MSITVAWDDDAHTIIRYTFTSPWTWDEYRAAIDRAWELARAVDHPTDTITDMSRSHLWPENLFRHIRRSVVEIPESTQTIVLVGAGKFVELALEALRRVYGPQGSKFFTAATLDEARELIRRRRA